MIHVRHLARCLRYSSVFLVAIGAGQPMVVRAQEPGDDSAGIVFATLRITASSVEIVSLDVRPGRLKRAQRGSGPGRYIMETAAASGDVLTTQVIDNPLVRRYEYVDPESGRMKVLRVELDEQVVMVRLPYREHATTLSLFAIEGGEVGTGKTPRHADGGWKRRLVGSVSLDAIR